MTGVGASITLTSPLGSYDCSGSLSSSDEIGTGSVSVRSSVSVSLSVSVLSSKVAIGSVPENGSVSLSVTSGNTTGAAVGLFIPRVIAKAVTATATIAAARIANFKTTARRAGFSSDARRTNFSSIPPMASSNS